MQTNQISTKRVDIRQLPALAKAHIPEAKFPELYLAARSALQECSRIDEIKDMRDKHSAIAHYAKQAKDDSLFKYAERIKLRAIERIGELLAEFPDTEKRKVMAKENGISPGVANDAVYIAAMPKRTRDALIDADEPPKYREITGIARGYSGEDRRYRFWKHTDKERLIKDEAYQLYNIIEEFHYDMLMRKTDNMQDLLGKVERLPDDELRVMKSNIETIWEFLDLVEMAASRMIRINNQRGVA